MSTHEVNTEMRPIEARPSEVRPTDATRPDPSRPDPFAPSPRRAHSPWRAEALVGLLGLLLGLTLAYFLLV